MHDDEREGAQREQPLPWLGARVRISVRVRVGVRVGVRVRVVPLG